MHATSLLGLRQGGAGALPDVPRAGSELVPGTGTSPASIPGGRRSGRGQQSRSPQGGRRGEAPRLSLPQFPQRCGAAGTGAAPGSALGHRPLIATGVQECLQSPPKSRHQASLAALADELGSPPLLLGGLQRLGQEDFRVASGHVLRRWDAVPPWRCMGWGTSPSRYTPGTPSVPCEAACPQVPPAGAWVLSFGGMNASMWRGQLRTAWHGR